MPMEALSKSYCSPGASVPPSRCSPQQNWLETTIRSICQSDLKAPLSFKHRRRSQLQLLSRPSILFGGRRTRRPLAEVHRGAKNLFACWGFIGSPVLKELKWGHPKNKKPNSNLVRFGSKHLRILCTYGPRGRIDVNAVPYSPHLKVFPRIVPLSSNTLSKVLPYSGEPALYSSEHPALTSHERKLRTVSQQQDYLLVSWPNQFGKKNECGPFCCRYWGSGSFNLGWHRRMGAEVGHLVGWRIRFLQP